MTKNFNSIFWMISFSFIYQLSKFYLLMYFLIKLVVGNKSQLITIVRNIFAQTDMNLLGLKKYFFYSTCHTIYENRLFQLIYHQDYLIRNSSQTSLQKKYINKSYPKSLLSVLKQKKRKAVTIQKMASIFYTYTANRHSNKLKVYRYDSTSRNFRDSWM